MIESDPTGSMIQISFVPSQTVTEEFRTGKPPVYTKMSRMELLNFLEARSKGEYYLDNIAYGTPGRKGNSPVSFDLTGSGLSSGFLQMLSFMPVTEVRNILGIIKAGIEVSKGKAMFGNLDKYVDGF
ncbi:hypothetical protein [Herbiconiux daphne]|uniref:Uncharacterized protein n=2 Tax=Actinomycetes TaxID=1760 RepID=A0ABT2H996_9MICO|nr:hypothetical protein [Herbiconiux daphne]MCS5736506.1 hypothetical protein [Herbiconiux daphne]